MPKLNVLWMSDSPVLNTGYAKVTWQILSRLKDTYNVHCAGWFHPSDQNEYRLGFPVYPAGTDFGHSAIGSLLSLSQPDVIVGLGDFWMLDWWREANLKTVAPCVLYSLLVVLQGSFQEYDSIFKSRGCLVNPLLRSTLMGY